MRVPFVTKVQKLAERAAAEGRDVVVVGNPDHPEMIGVVGYAPANSHVVRDASEVANLPALHAPLVVSQTTIKLSTFLEAAEAVRAKADSEPQIVNTICSATRDRQDAARALANTPKLFTSSASSIVKPPSSGFRCAGSNAIGVF